MTESTLQLTPDEVKRSLENLKLERDAIVLYEALATIEKDQERAAAFERIAGNERRHASIWAERLESAGATVPPADRPRARVRLIIALARRLGTGAVADMVQALEGDEESSYADQMTPETAAIAADEREHAAIWRELQDGPSAAAASRSWSRTGQEAWHKTSRSGTLRATVFGANDGLVSNLSLVMGVAGATADNHFIVLAGIAGLLAGAFSMAAGEYISMQSQREVFERQIAVEREEMRVMPDVEQKELEQIYRAKGLPPADAARVAAHLMEDPQVALDTKVREELGLDPDELGSSWGAAISSFVAFSIGAVIPLLPFLLTTGTTAFVAALALSFTALFLIGAAVSVLTGRNLIYSGARQVAIGAAAAAVTYLVGTLIGANAA
jgi:VIT1/CCC1 family predicted Fe2+/Mn2+ transporter